MLIIPRGRIQPPGRMGDPEHDIGRAVVFLVVPDPEFITGISLPVDGGGLYLP
jgi:NAD(P)-dependent dehydrogenase (short-subunit alcohol dehydrogenase family)